jgi:predicted mannosyl-3-phosphoglycerate phosphatase (HAD superfamily)
MFSPRQIIFTAVDDLFLNPTGEDWEAASDAFAKMGRQGIPLILCSSGTRVQIDPVRRTIQHGHPFMTESGSGLFIPDGYFNLRLEGATRTGRTFCVPFARPQAEAAAALPEIAKEAGASVVGFSQMSLREIAQNSGLSTQDAELYRQREFGELFFFAGETEKTTKRFLQVAQRNGWEALPGAPFWELRGPLKQNAANGVQYLMAIFRKALHGRQRSVGIGGSAADLYFLSITDVTVVLPPEAGDPVDGRLSRLPRAVRSERGGLSGWSEAILRLLERR